MEKQPKPNDSFKIITIEMRKFFFQQIGILKEKEQIELDQSITAYASKNEDQYDIQVAIKLNANCSSDELFCVDSVIVSKIEVNENFQEDSLNNMVAIIYSYLRPMVAQMTAMAKLPLLDLPPMNLEGFKVNIKP